MKKWYMETKKFPRLLFYHSLKNSNPLETVEDFDRGGNYSVDCLAQVKTAYPIDPEDNCFVLIPKTEVVRVWSEELTTP